MESLARTYELFQNFGSNLLILHSYFLVSSKLDYL